MQRVMVFGTFDLLHPGHEWFLERAAGYGDELIAVVARDSAVMKLKGQLPLHDETVRRAAVEHIAHVSRSVLGDTEQGTYRVLREHPPDMICLGYDQDALAEDLTHRMAAGLLPRIRLEWLGAYQPERFKTSLLRC